MPRNDPFQRPSALIQRSAATVGGNPQNFTAVQFKEQRECTAKPESGGPRLAQSAVHGIQQVATDTRNTATRSTGRSNSIIKGTFPH